MTAGGFMARMAKIFSTLALFVFLTTNLWGQGIFATLTGIVTDPSGSVVPDAKVVLKDAQSGSARETVTNGEGYYTFASVPVGAYIIPVDAKGFQTYKADQISLGGGERRNINATLVLAGTTQTVEVVAEDFTIAAVDSGEKSFTLAAKELQNFTQVGSNAAEYIKITPGFSINAMTGNKASYTGQTIGINANGDSGSQSPLNNNFSYNEIGRAHV